MIYTAGFHASHAIVLGAKAEPAHGHNWLVRAEFSGDGSKTAGEALVNAIEPLSNRHLNDLPQFSKRIPSAEAIASYFYSVIKEMLKSKSVVLQKVSVREEPGCWASFEEGRVED